jgi:16S rRNA (adenine1518-N6/adenine1519-N6)-dimethyltransferase
VTGRTARKRFGQHFLEPAWVAKVLRTIGPEPDETFLEIGPGHGELTYPLAARARRVVAFEIDRDLVSALRASAPPNLVIVEGDFLHASEEGLRPLFGGARTVRIAGNLPYNVASPVLFKLVTLVHNGLSVADGMVMLQREVADRLAAAPGTRDYGVLTVLIGRRAAAERVLALPSGAFRPPPKVQSALVRLTFHPPEPPASSEDAFEQLVKSVFMHRRKTLRNALAAAPATQALARPEVLALAGLDGRRRPETLSIEELVRLSNHLVI